MFATDVLICGGGCAGLGAALAAARNGARTLLIERAGFAGGIITCAGLPYFDGIAHRPTGLIVVRGIALEFLAELGVCEPGAERIDPHNPRIPHTDQFKLLTDRLLTAESDRLQVLFHTFACAVEMQGDRISAVRVANKDGLVTIQPQVVIDCTGDGDIGAWAGAPVTKTLPLMPMSLHFRIGHVPRGLPETGRKCQEACLEAHAAGKLPMFYGPGLIYHYADDDVYVHAVRVAGDPTDAADLTRAEMQGRRDAWTMWQIWKEKVPAFRNSYFIGMYPWIGIRESRHVEGPYVLTDDDIRQNRKFDDAVATGCWYLDVHPNEATPGAAQREPGFQPDPYDIPYRSLLARGVSNLLVAGRCHSATPLAASSTRVTVTAMAMGQAAGTAAALALQRREDPAALDGRVVRNTLHQQHAGPYVGR